MIKLSILECRTLAAQGKALLPKFVSCVVQTTYYTCANGYNQDQHG